MSDKTTSLTYDQLTNEEKVYMFEFIFPESVRLIMQDRQITAYTDFVPPELQKERPRAEIVFIPAAGQSRFRRVNGIARESAWAGSFQFTLITAPDMAIHGRYVSKIRALIHQLYDLINMADPMSNHKLQEFSIDSGTSGTFKADEGYYQTIINLAVNVSIQDNAWTLITN
jgi:hypothetical protein